MQNRNCKRCGEIFPYVNGYPLCKECREKDEEEFQRVREYVRDNPGVNIEQVAQAIGLPPQQVLRYLQEERLETFSRSDKHLLCEMCGSIINTGRYCEKCKAEINRELQRDNGGKLGDVYYLDEDEERKINKLKNKAQKFGK